MRVVDGPSSGERDTGAGALEGGALVVLSGLGPVAALIVLVLGGIYGGVFTPTEAGAIAAVYGFLASMFVYRELTWQRLVEAGGETLRASAGILLIGGSGNVAVITAAGDTVTLPVVAGMVLPLRVSRVLSTNTTATPIVAMA